MKNSDLDSSSALQLPSRPASRHLTASSLPTLFLLFAFALPAHSQTTAPGEWTWMGGSSTVPNSTSGIYGTLGVPASENSPGGRDKANTWTDGSGNLWLFGGIGFDGSGNQGDLNDLWEFNPATGLWTWVSGGTEIAQTGVYGSLGSPAAGSVPGSRYGCVAWTDSDGNLWLFGGAGSDAYGNDIELNDLWEFNPVTNLWGWMGGDSATDMAGIYGALGTPLSGNLPGGRHDASSWTDSSGNLWLFGGAGDDANGSYGWLNDLWEFNPATGLWAWMGGSETIGDVSGGQAGVYGTLGTSSAANVPGGRYDAVDWIDNGGNLWLFGGVGYDANNNWGWLNDLWEFNPATGLWAWIGGSSTLLSGGVGQAGVYGTLGSSASGNIPGGRYDAAGWTDNCGNFWLFGGDGFDANDQAGYLNDLWTFNPTANQWTWIGGSSSIGDASGGQSGVYGTLGIPAAGNIPGGRLASASWKDNSGNFWFFGGEGITTEGIFGWPNDLWAYQPPIPIPIIPYLQVNGAEWQAGNTASVTLGSTVNLGPWPASGGSWSWTGPNGFTATAREVDGIPLTLGADTFVATYTVGGISSTETFTITVTACSPIVPYVEVNGVWNATPQSAVTVNSGDSVSLGPWPVSGGSWSWSGPNGFASTSREIDGIALSAGDNAYTATYTADGVSYTQAFVVTVNAANPIVPYVEVNGVWNATPQSAVTVNSGDSVNLGPWPVSGGSWSWTGPNGFTSTSREIDGIALSAGDNAYTATYTADGVSYTQAFVVTVNAANPIVPYVEVNGVWNATPQSAVTVNSGDSVNLGPWPVSGGSWSWTGPNGFTSTSREIDGIALSAGDNAYTATYTVDGVSYTQAFVVTVNAANPIVPYIAVNGVWNATPQSTVTVPLGTIVNLGPWPLGGGSWSWTGPNGFTAASSEIDNIALSVGANVYTATYTVNGNSYTQAFVVTVGGCGAANEIVPYVEVNAVWNAVPQSAVTVSSGDSVDLGPWPLGGGSWSWTGPNGFTSIGREIDGIALSEGANVYTATYTDPNACIYTLPFTVTVD